MAWTGNPHPTRWNPFDKTANTTLSNGDKTAAAVSANSGVRGLGCRDEMRHYWEVTINATTQGTTAIGIASAYVNMANIAAVPETCYVATNGTIYNGGSSTGINIGALVAGDIVSIALDSYSNQFYARKNGGFWNGNPSADLGSPGNDGNGVYIHFSLTGNYGWYAFVAFPQDGSPHEQVTGNFGLLPTPAFAYAVPQYYNGGLFVHGSIWSTTDLQNMTLAVDTYSSIEATSTTTPSWVRTYLGKNHGKYYWEMQVSPWANSSTAVGITNGTTVPSFYNVAKTAFIRSTGLIYNNGSSTGITLTGVAAGVSLGFALDCDAGLLWIRVAPSGLWNNNASADPATGIGGINVAAMAGGAYSFYPVFEGNAANEKALANFGDYSFTGAVPTGYIDGVPGGLIGGTLTTPAVATQASVEEWEAPIVIGQITQVAAENWASVASGVVQGLVTQVSLEEWFLVPLAGRTKVWNGSTWVLKPVKVWDGSAWNAKPLKVWNGSTWT